MSIVRSKIVLSGKHKDVGGRLREFGEREFGSMKAFAQKLGISVQHLSPYINGKHIPGNKLQAQLEKLGCNVHYLITGETRDQLEAKLMAMRERIVNESISKEKIDMLEFLDGFGIFSVAELKKYINFEKLAKKLIDSGADSKHQTKK